MTKITKNQQTILNIFLKTVKLSSSGVHEEMLKKMKIYLLLP